MRPILSGIIGFSLCSVCGLVIEILIETGSLFGLWLTILRLLAIGLAILSQFLIDRKPRFPELICCVIGASVGVV